MDLTNFRAFIKKEWPAESFHIPKRIAATWSQTWFGFRQSPEVCFIMHHLAEELIRGFCRDPHNHLRFDRVIINAGGTQNYNPALPNVFKYDSINKKIAGDFIGYVDDLRTLGLTLEEAWQIARQVGSRLQHLGVQDAGQKRRITTGPWAGGIYSTDNGKITKTVTKCSKRG